MRRYSKLWRFSAKDSVIGRADYLDVLRPQLMLLPRGGRFHQSPPHLQRRTCAEAADLRIVPEFRHSQHLEACQARAVVQGNEGDLLPRPNASGPPGNLQFSPNGEIRQRLLYPGSLSHGKFSDSLSSGNSNTTRGVRQRNHPENGNQTRINRKLRIKWEKLKVMIFILHPSSFESITLTKEAKRCINMV